MAAAAFKSVDAYLASQPEGARDVLAKVRAVLRKALPDADEVIAYNMPAFAMNGVAVVYFAGWKKHWALYPANRHVVATLGVALASYDVEKGTARFGWSEVPVRLITRIARVRAIEVESKRAKPAKPTKKRQKTSR